MTCNAQSMDSIASPSDYSLLSMQYIWLHTSNPVAYLNVKSNPMNGQISYNHISGNYKYISDPQSMNRGNIAVEGFKKVNKLQFYGSFSYDISKLNEQRWKNVLMPSTGNPFILGDSIGGNYDNETFEIKGIVTSSFNEKLKWPVIKEGVLPIRMIPDQKSMLCVIPSDQESCIILMIGILVSIWNMRDMRKTLPLPALKQLGHIVFSCFRD